MELKKELLEKLLLVLGNLEAGKAVEYNGVVVYIADLFVELKEILNGQSN